VENMTVQEALNMAYDLLQMRGFVTGTVDSAKVVRTNAEAVSLINLWQNEVFKYASLRDSFEFFSSPPAGLIVAGYEALQVNASTYILDGEGSVQCYTFEINMPCVVHIEDYDGAWNSLNIITKLGDDIERFYGSVIPTANATMSRIRIVTSYFGVIKNYALYSNNYFTVPEYRLYKKIALPSNFKWEELIVEESHGYQQSQYERQGQNLIVSNNVPVSARLVYRPIPTNLTSLTDTLPFDDMVNRTAPWFLAAQFSLFIDPITGNYFQQKYEEEREAIKPPMQPHDIEDVYGNFDA